MATMKPFILSIFLCSAVLGAIIEINPTYQVVREGDKFTILCKTAVPLDYCKIEMPGEGPLVLSEKKAPFHGIAYFGKGLAAGECGATIPQARQKHNGDIRCAVTGIAENKESSANMTLVVAKAPTRPSMSVRKSQAGSEIYMEGESLIAECTVQNGRPPANISWFLGEERLYSGISSGDTVRATDDLYSTKSKLTRVVQASDNGKPLKCQAEHPLLRDVDSSTSTSHIIEVHFAPKAKEPIEQFGLVEGEDGRVAVVVMAHPKPTFKWNIDGTSVYETDENDRFKVERAIEIPPKSGNWESVLVIKSLTKEDVDKAYTLIASNNQGEKSFRVNISTSPGPQGLDLGAGAIVAIVASALILIVIVAMIAVARVKGRWCFAGGVVGGGDTKDPEKLHPHDNGGNDNPAVNHNNSTEYITTPDVKKPKEDTPV